MNLLASAVLCGILSILLRLLIFSNRRAANLPPGPKGHWIFGNLGDLLSENQRKKYAAWSKTFGDIIYLTVLGRPVIVLNKFEHARELMDKRGALYSDRPRMPYIVDLIRIRSVTFMPYGDQWRSHRRLLQQYLNPRAVAAFRQIQTKCVRDLLKDLLVESDAFRKHIKQFAASAVLSATYGYTPLPEDDPLIMLNTHSEKALINSGPPGATLVDLLPILRFIPSFIPGASFKRLALDAREALDEMATRPYKSVREQRASGMALPSLMTHMLDDFERQGIQDEKRFEVIRDVCGSTYRGEKTNLWKNYPFTGLFCEMWKAGITTTFATLSVFVLAAVLHPDFAKKSQEELDTVLGDDRLPTFEDQDSLPYINCILKECLRWGPPTPLGNFASCNGRWRIGGKVYTEGFHDRAESLTCFSEFRERRYMTHDERNYNEPENFDPDRFIKASEAEPSVLNPALIVFGFGRRICPGRHFAEADLWLAIASILTTFDILTIRDEHGFEVLPKAEFAPGLNSWPKEFSCRFVPRSEKAAILVKKAG